MSYVCRACKAAAVAVVECCNANHQGHMYSGSFRASGCGNLRSNRCRVGVLVTGVASGDTCTGIAQKFKLSQDFFNLINPNLNCNKLFVDQWLCVDGKAT